MTKEKHTHPTPAHKAACPVCHPDKTVPQLNDAYRASKQCPFNGEHFSSMARAACEVCNPQQRGVLPSGSHTSQQRCGTCGELKFHCKCCGEDKPVARTSNQEIIGRLNVWIRHFGSGVGIRNESTRMRILEDLRVAVVALSPVETPQPVTDRLARLLRNIRAESREAQVVRLNSADAVFLADEIEAHETSQPATAKTIDIAAEVRELREVGRCVSVALERQIEDILERIAKAIRPDETLDKRTIFEKARDAIIDVVRATDGEQHVLAHRALVNMADAMRSTVCTDMPPEEPSGSAPQNCDCPNGSYSKKHRHDCPLKSSTTIRDELDDAEHAYRDSRTDK